VQTGFHTHCALPTGFRNLPTGKRRPQRLAGLFHPAGTPRVWPSEVDSWLIGNCLQPTYSCAVIRPSWIPSIRYTRFPIDRPPGFTLSAILHRMAPLPSLNGWLPSGAWTDLGALLPTRLASSAEGFHPLHASAPLLAFFSLRDLLTDDPGPKPSPLRGSDLLRVLLPSEMATPRTESLPSWSLCLMTRTSSLDRGIPRLSFPFGDRRIVTN